MDKGSRGESSWVVVGPQGVYYIGLHDKEEDVWEIALGWPSAGEVAELKRNGWYAAEATLTWKKP